MSKKIFIISLLSFFAFFVLSACSDGNDSELEEIKSPKEENDENNQRPDPVEEEAFAFPGAEGFGKHATGGRGGRVIKVTSLEDFGPGSFREAVMASGPRIVVFEVSGTIELKTRLTIRNGDLTIAGQTAPGDGIAIANHEVYVDADNVIIRFMRFRVGDTADAEYDALGGRFRKNIIIDHCSMSWSTDECVSFYGNDEFTLQWCVISESLRMSAHEKGAHGYGAIWGGKNASFHHNLLAHHDSRNPRFGEFEGSAYALTNLVDFRNNIIYNWGNNSAYGAEGGNVNIVNNYYKPGPASRHRERIMSIDKYLRDPERATYDIWGRFFIDGNFVEGSTRATNDNWTYGVYNQFHSKYGTVSDEDKAAMRLDSEHPINGNVTTHTAEEAFDIVLEFAGASLVRDAVDARVIEETRNGTFTYSGSRGSTNGIIDSQEDVGGWPELDSLPVPVDTSGDGMPDEWKIAHGLDPEKNEANGRDLSTAYDNVEVYINSLVQHIMDAKAVFFD
ncbi:pectate lyase family protein [Alkalitalea saponilacus]|uniref:Pectate lyase n=1 Tax=Alkalitalea saponilacus TaxID=889453 RepID=A0A1T5ERZ6_9BACT|nr:pectate lyase [Alkalitalea saponilacus]ASB48047.1 pectate lyase [Alkalitalea saponilacus]SKB86711.1 Pectate lyase [Alkalitalea saponilacus]